MKTLIFVDVVPQCIGAADNGDGTYRLDFASTSRLASKAEIESVTAIEQAEAVKVAESTTARDDTKRALTALDTIIANIDGATLAQAKAAIKQEAQILRHLILATVGR